MEEEIGMEGMVYRILKILQSHKGKDRPIVARALSKKLNLPEREVRRLISELVTEHKILIASRVQKPYGFYLITNLTELKECLNQYYSRLKNLKDRASSLYKAGLKRFSKELQNEFKFS
jgi:hypothetical protein